jgi:hypothetical protein
MEDMKNEETKGSMKGMSRVRMDAMKKFIIFFDWMP